MGDEFDPVEDALEAYAEAKKRSQVLRAEWRGLGEPAMEMGGSTGKTPVEHPLLRAMRQAEQHEAKLRESLRRRHAGPVPFSDRFPVPASTRLRAGEPPRLKPVDDVPRVTLNPRQGAERV